MRVALLVAMMTSCIVGIAAARTAGDGSIPRRIGYRANGFSYQPTPHEVIPKEKAAGVRPSMASQRNDGSGVGRH